MNSAFSHVDTDVQALLFDSAAERIRFLDRSGFVPWPQASRALQAILSQGEEALPSQPSFVMVEGPPRSGRSEILKEAHRQLRAAYPLERRSVLIAAPSSSLEARLIHTVGVATSVPSAAARLVSARRGRVINGLRLDGSRVLIADNLHDASPTVSAARSFLPIWRNFCDEASVSGAFSVTRRSKEWLAADPQLQARTQVFTLTQWPEQLWVAKVVEAALRRYPLRRHTKVSGEFMEVLYGATGGWAGRAFSKLKEAARMAISTGEEAISADLLRKAVQQGGRA
jgi:hypothetical protein